MKLLGSVENCKTKHDSVLAWLTIFLFIAAELNLNLTLYINEIKGSNWFDVFSYCKSLGLDLFSPDNSETNQQLFNLLEDYGLNSAASIAIGGSRFGTKCFWYSTKTGNEIDFKFSPKDFTRDNIWNNYCLQLVKHNKVFKFQDVDCYENSDFFICEHAAEPCC
jgi:hypothetical protein